MRAAAFLSPKNDETLDSLAGETISGEKRTLTQTALYRRELPVGPAVVDLNSGLRMQAQSIEGPMNGPHTQK